MSNKKEQIFRILPERLKRMVDQVMTQEDLDGDLYPCGKACLCLPWREGSSGELYGWQGGTEGDRKLHEQVFTLCV